MGLLVAALGAPGAVAAPFTPPTTARQAYDFNIGWKFIKQEVPGAEAPTFDDGKWETVTTPHTYNDIDTFDEIITRGGEKGAYMGPAWYRKQFKLPASAAGQKVLIEFEGMRNTGRIYLNGKEISYYTNGVTVHGIDITDSVKFDGDNVMAVRVENSRIWEDANGAGYQWSSKDFNPNYGGINRHVRLHITPKVYQTLPIFDGLKTTGVYVYAKDISIPGKTADIFVESQVKNEAGEPRAIDLAATIVDAEGNVQATLKGETYDTVSGESGILKAEGKLANARFWSPEDPYLYDVYTTLTIDGKVVDVVKTTTGFRKTEFKGGAGTGGVFINDKFTYLKGYAQRATNEWAGLGQAYPDWMHDYSAKLLRDNNANYIRWMHVSPQPADVRSYDKFGIVQIVPAGDKERDGEGAQWAQRVDVMRSTIIYHRNSPSILFWEAGNSGVSTAHMKEMQELAQKYDPTGGRVMGCRSLQEESAVDAAGFVGIMVGSDVGKDQRKTPTDIFRAYSEVRRDKMPMIEVEDFRDEAARRFWDDYSPPHFGFKKKEADTWNYNQETYSIAAAKRYAEYLDAIVTNTDSAKARWSGYASIIFSDTNSHGRQYGSEVCRNSGKVDAVRLPKQSYYTYRVVQNPNPDLHILGHWNYPDATKKTVYVISNCESVELIVNGKSLGKNAKPEGRFVFAFPDVAFAPGKIKAIAHPKSGSPIEQEIATAGEPKKIKLTPILNPTGFKADGADVALFDVEVTDANGLRCPTDEERIDFAVTGPSVWRGGYNSGRPGSTNNLFLYTECGINRVAIRSTQTPGAIKLVAKRDGLEAATVEVKTEPVKGGI
ncbi:MAG: DUF4982 domain-containing protein [Burkholderiales bacterium]|nr:DUF4982 domain-containing protein [Phycisphaerae bacterium]